MPFDIGGFVVNTDRIENDTRVGIVTSGLVLHLDAEIPESYPLSGTTWYDYSGNGRNATLYGTTSVSTGYVDIGSGQDTSNYITIPSTALNGLTSWTIELWLYLHATNSIDTFLTCGAGNDFLWFFSGNSIEFQNTGATNISYSISLTTPFLFTATGTGGSINIYKNGSYVGNMSNTTTITVNSSLGIVLGQEMDSNGGAFDGTQKFRGKYGPIKFYNRVLSSTEITQNFNATRKRFGL